MFIKSHAHNSLLHYQTNLFAIILHVDVCCIALLLLFSLLPEVKAMIACLLWVTFVSFVSLCFEPISLSTYQIIYLKKLRNETTFFFFLILWNVILSLSSFEKKVKVYFHFAHFVSSLTFDPVYLRWAISLVAFAFFRPMMFQAPFSFCLSFTSDTFLCFDGRFIQILFPQGLKLVRKH